MILYIESFQTIGSYLEIIKDKKGQLSIGPLWTAKWTQLSEKPKLPDFLCYLNLDFLRLRILVFLKTLWYLVQAENPAYVCKLHILPSIAFLSPEAKVISKGHSRSLAFKS